MATASAGIRRRSALVGTLQMPIGGQAVADQTLAGRISGNMRTRRQSAAEVGAQAEFDKNVLPGLSEHQPKYVNNMPAAGPTLAARDAASRADPYALDYAENTSGTFGSQRGTPEVRKAIPVSPVNRTDGLVSGTVSGLAEATRPAGPSPVTAAPIAAPVSTLPTPSGPPAPTGLATPNYQPAPAETPSLPTTTYNVPGKAVPSSVPAGPTPAVTPAPVAASTPTAVPTPGRSTEAGVSNSQAAQFTQPTKANPIPETPTTPILDVNEFDKRGKRAFAGF